MADKDKQDDELTAVGPGAEMESSEDQTDERAAGDDYTPAEDEGQEESGDERAGHAEGEEEGSTTDGQLSREQKRRRRKREKYERDQRELNFLRQRNEQLERQQSQRLAEVENRQSQNEMLAIDGRINQAASDVRQAEELYQEALSKQDAAAATEALRVRDDLRDGLRNLQGVKAQAAQAARQRQAAPQQQQQNAPDPAVVRRAQQWAADHRDWFDPSGNNEDSAVAYAVERRLYGEGRLDPSSDEYYEELDRRLAKRMPENYRNMRNDDRDDEDDDRDDELDDRRDRRETRRQNGNSKRASGGPAFRTGGRERTLRKGEVYVDPERRRAMEEAGVWDDEKLRQRYLASYQKYDRDHGRRRQ